MRLLTAAAVAALVLAAVILATRLDWIELDAEPAPEQPGVTLPSTWQRGANLTAYDPDGYGSPAAAAELERLAALGVDHVALVPLWFMDSAGSNELAADPAATTTDAGLEQAVATARELGMTVAIAPHVDVRDGTFRGLIAPTDPAAWFASYRRLLDQYAELAARTGASQFVVGTELTSMTADQTAWRALIARARRRFDGQLTYAANWVDEAERIEFWDALDELGINAYMPLETGVPSPTVAALVEAWLPYRQRIETLHERWQLPVVFTELGYQSREDAAAAGGTPATGPVSQQAQADAYEAAYRAWAQPDWFRGIWWWDWSVDGGDPDGGGFTPEGKLAERVVGSYNGGSDLGLGESP